MSYIFHNDKNIDEKINNTELSDKINNIETMLKLIIKKLNIETDKKPVNIVDLYGLKPLSFYTASPVSE
jgi:hypothetical protein